MNPTLNIFYDNEYHENMKGLDYSVTQYDNLSSEEAKEFSEIMTAVRTFAEEQRAKFVKGEHSFDEWGNYLEEMKKIGGMDCAMELLTAHEVK